MSGEKPNPLDVALHQSKTTAERLNIDEGIHNILKYPKRSLIVSIPVKMNNARALGLTEAGLMLSAFFFADMLLGFPAGVISDKFGGRINVVVGTVIAGLASIGLVYTTSFEMLLLNIALFGAGVGFFCPILPALAINMTFAGERERAIGLLRAIQDLGFMTGPIVFGLAADLLGVQWAMSIGTAPYFIATLLALKKLKASA